MPAKLKAGVRRSRNEVNFENQLKARKIPYEYEPDSFTLLPTMDTKMGRVNKITYTPDWKLIVNGQVVWIETKGYARAEDLLKSKLAAMYFWSQRKEIYLMVGSFGRVWSGLNDFYVYKNKNRISTLENGLKNKSIIKRNGQYYTKLFGRDTETVFTKAKTLWEDLDELTK